MVKLSDLVEKLKAVYKEAIDVPEIGEVHLSCQGSEVGVLMTFTDRKTADRVFEEIGDEPR